MEYILLFHKRYRVSHVSQKDDVNLVYILVMYLCLQIDQQTMINSII